jgi:hypothetical protein
MDERTFSSDMIATGVQTNESVSERSYLGWVKGECVVDEVGIWPLSREGEVHSGVEIGARRLTDAAMPKIGTLKSFNDTTV